MHHRLIYISAFTVLVAFYGCKTESTPSEGEAGTPNETSEPGEGGEASVTPGNVGGDRGGSGEVGESVAGGPAGEAGFGGSSGAATGGSGEGGSGDISFVPTGNLRGPLTDEITMIGEEYVQNTGNVHSLFVDSNGNVYIAGYQRLIGNPDPTVGYLTKLDEDLTEVWTRTIQAGTVTGQDIGLNVMQVAGDEDGNSYLVGQTTAIDALPGETARGGADLVVGKYTTDGEEAWMHQYGSSADERAEHVAIRSDGSVLAIGPTFGQLPGQPSESLGSPFSVVFSNAGALGQVKQLSMAGLLGMAIDPDDNFYLSSLAGISKHDATNNLVWDSTIPDVRSLAMVPAGGALYSFGRFLGENLNRHSPLQRIDAATGAVDWSRLPADHVETIDPVEGVIWTGRFYGSYALAVSDDAVFIAGTYQNSYEFGSVARPTTKTGYLARYDLRGNQQWFKQFQFFQQNYVGEIYPAALAVAPGGDSLVVAATGLDCLIFKLDAHDGTLL